MKNVAFIIGVISLTMAGCSVQKSEYIKYDNFGKVQNIKCSDNNVCMIETNNTVAIVKSENLPSSPNTNDSLYKITYTTPFKTRDMWCINQSCKPVDTCISVTGKCI